MRWHGLPALALAALVLASALPTAAQSDDVAVGETSRVTFYGHIFNTGLDFPMPANTQYPWGEADFATSGPIDDTHCAPAQPVAEPCDTQHNTKLVLFTTAGPVTVKEPRDFDYAKIHNEFGLSQDVVFDTSQSVNATLYITPASTHGWLHTPAETPCLNGDPPENVPCYYPYWRWHAGVAPNFQVKAWLYAMELGEHGASASTQPPIREKLPGATLVAYGETEPRTTISSDGYGDNPRVHRFDIDLGAPQVARIPRTHDLVMVFSWNHDVGGVEYMADTWRINSGEFFATSFTVPIKNAFTVESVQVASIHDRIVVLSTMNTPWGSYDVDPTSVELTIERADGRAVTVESLQTVADFQVAHGAHYRPINITYVWDWRTDGAEPGEYVVNVRGANFQRSAWSEAEARFTLTSDGRLVDVDAGRQGVQTGDLTLEGDAGLNATAAPDVGSVPDDNASPLPPWSWALLALAAVLGGRRRQGGGGASGGAHLARSGRGWR